MEELIKFINKIEGFRKSNPEVDFELLDLFNRRLNCVGSLKELHTVESRLKESPFMIVTRKKHYPIIPDSSIKLLGSLKAKGSYLKYAMDQDKPEEIIYYSILDMKAVRIRGRLASEEHLPSLLKVVHVKDIDVKRLKNKIQLDLSVKLGILMEKSKNKQNSHIKKCQRRLDMLKTF